MQTATATMAAMAAPHRTPWTGSRRTGTASNQYWRGPGEKALRPVQPVAWVIWPTRGGLEVRTAHDRIVMTALSWVASQPEAACTSATTSSGPSPAAWQRTRQAVLDHEPRRRACSAGGFIPAWARGAVPA